MLVSATPRDIRNYVTEDGKKPYDKWIRGLKDKTVRARISARIDRVALGNFGDVRSVGEGVQELRFTFGSGPRVYFAIDGEEIILLLCGGIKRTQDDDIKTAKSYWADYKRRKSHGKSE